ncbi:MAG TPA: glycoside hydrolase family 25 protein [bacterium]|nr:glycoside hydrolase family 25 protein [bacterium]
MIEGVDVSHYQGLIDWPRVAAAGKKFAILKATDGMGMGLTGPKKRNVDALFNHNEQGAIGTQIVLGMYHFMRPLENLQGQINSFIAMEHWSKDALFPMLDLEPIKQGPGTQEDWAVNSKQDNLMMVLEWLHQVERNTGYKAVIYTTNFFVEAFLPLAPELAEYPLALARYSSEPGRIPPPWRTWNFWQYDPAGKVDGIQGTVDLDYFDGTLEDLKTLTRKRMA